MQASTEEYAIYKIHCFVLACYAYFFRDFAFVTSCDIAFVTSCDITFVYVICKDQLIVLSDLMFLVLYLMHKDLYISAHDFIQGPESFNLILIPPLMKMEQASC